MTPGTYNLSLYRGDSYSYKFVLWQDVGQTVPLSLAGATVKAEVRDKSAGTKIVVLGSVVTLPNTITVTVTPAMYATMPTTGVWDLQVTFGTGEVNTMVAGSVAVVPDVTDSQALALLELEQQQAATAPADQITVQTNSVQATLAAVRARR